MCGYLGSVTKNTIDMNSLIESNQCQICRGPDETRHVEKTFGNKEYHLALIFNRLSIIDLSQNASQPMFSKEFGTTLMFNGEIYNHFELRKELEKKCKFNTSHSDTEVVLNGLSLEGAKFLDKMRGQFSLAFFHNQKNQILLARDRLGQKPLFYKHSSNSLEFSTNLKSLVNLTKNNKIDEEQLINYLNFGVVVSPNTIFKNIYKVNPATFIIFELNENINLIEKNLFWNINNYVARNKFNQENFEELFNEAVKYRLVSDVPIATFLSGGLDSTSITKSLYKLDAEINTFSIIHNEKKYDESKWINEVVKKYNTTHTEIKITTGKVYEEIFNSINSLDEPYADPSVVPSYILSKEISCRFKVALSGDGGDELLGGYQRFQEALINRNIIENLISKLYPIYPSFFGSGSKLQMKSKNKAVSYFSTLEDDKLLSLLGLKSNFKLKDNFYTESLGDFKDLMLSEYKFFLSEMMLLKVDRTSMQNSLEVRSPFLDHKLIEYVLSSDMENIIKNNSKSPIKNFLSNDFDENFLNRNKMGFSFNLESWIYKNLNFIEDTFKSGNIVNSLNSNILKNLGLFKTTINAHRIWKLIVLDFYLKSY